MPRYLCCYNMGKQHVFEERADGSYPGLILSSLFGIFCGVALGAISALLGPQAVSGLGSSMFLLAVRRAYQLTFLEKSSSREILAFLFWVFFFSAVILIFFFAVHWVSFHDPPLTVGRYTSLFGGAGWLVAAIAYFYYRVCCQEDERKHHLRVTKTGGYEDLSDEDRPRALGRFFKWIATCRWFSDLRDDRNNDQCEEPDAEIGTQIVVENRTLKLVKACLYSSEDYPCWIPFGGISGRGVAFISAEQRYAFNPPRGFNADRDFKLKIFQPGLCDKELASYPKAKRGQTFAFVDVDGMVKRQGSSLKKITAGISEDLEGSDISDDDKEPPTLLTSPALKSPATAVPRSPQRTYASCGAEPVELDIVVGRGLRRIASQDIVRPMNLTQIVPKGIPGLVGRAPTDREILLRNGGKEEIKAYLFRTNDYMCWVALDGQPSLISSDGDGASGVVKHGEERIFDPNFQAQEFTLKVYSVGPGAKELTYCTVERGQTYIFRDSTLS